MIDIDINNVDHPDWFQTPLDRELIYFAQEIDMLTELTTKLEKNLGDLAAIVFNEDRSPDDRLAACAKLLAAEGWQPNKGE